MRRTSPEVAALVFRGESIEAIHHASIAVVDAAGVLIHSLGDPYLVTMTRSSIKPFQLLPLLLSGAADKFRFTDRQLAIMCGSHTGSDEHRTVVLSNLEAIGCGPEHLRCGTHWPIGMQMRSEYPAADEDKDPVRHNCSGKHSGFLALARFLGEDPANYLEPESATQRLVKSTVADYLEYDIEKMPSGIDGCSAPNFPVPLRNLALGFKKLANGDGDSERVRSAVNRVTRAMTAYPLLVSGDGRFDYALSRSFPGNIVCKIGAEAIEGMGFARQGIGVAVKIYDGNFRALEPVCVETLRQLGLVEKPEDDPELGRFARPAVVNNRNLITGRIEARFLLKNEAQ